MNTDEQELAAILDAPPPTRRNGSEIEPSLSQPVEARAAITTVDFCQWQVLPNGCYRPGSKTIPKIPAAVYRCDADNYGPFISMIRLVSDNLMELPESSHLRVLDGIRKFWKVRKRYEKHGLVYKRGILLWGPPGGGKTVTTQLLVAELIHRHDGIVILCERPNLTIDILRILRGIEPERPLVVIMEDVDEIVQRFGEHELLAILDGEHQTSNVVYIATTNYPDRLGARIVNRPSRFDERIKIGMPTFAARGAYLAKVAKGVDSGELLKWCTDTEGLSIAHLRELVVAVVCLEQPYDSVMERLRGMTIEPKFENDGFRRKSLGFDHLNASAKSGANNGGYAR